MFAGQDMSRIEELIAKATGRMASKATIQTSTGILAYNLEPLLKQIYPVLAPFRNEALPRKVSPIGGTALNAKRMLSVNPVTGGLGIEEGKRGGRISVVEQDFSAFFRTIGQEADLTFEAEDAAEGFDDARAIKTTSLLNSCLMEEERMVLFGNGGNITVAGSSAQTALGTPSAPVLTNNGGATGTVAAATYNIWVVALTYQGYRNASVAGGVVATYNRTNLDGTTSTTAGGSSNSSAASNGITLGAPGSLAATVAAIPGAYAYAWYIGTSKAASALAAITPVNKVVITAPAAGTQAATAITTDNSMDALVFDGLITQVEQPSSGSYVVSLDGANLTSNGAGGIVEIDTMLQSMYDTFKLDPDEIWLDSKSATSINKKVIANGGAPLFRFTMDAKTGNVDGVGGGQVGRYVNPVTGRIIPLRVHPWFPQGTLFANSRTLPYSTPNVPLPYRLVPRVADWREYEWPVVTRQRAHGQYLTAAMIAYAPFAFGLIKNAGIA